MSNQPKYTIKPLVWTGDDRTAFANTGIGPYKVCDHQNFVCAYFKNRRILKGSGVGLEHAKLFCEGHLQGRLSEYLELASELQAVQYLLHAGTKIDWPILAEYSLSTKTWFVSHYQSGFLNKTTGEWSESATCDHPEYSFRTAEEAAECFYQHFPHLKHEPQQ